MKKLIFVLTIFKTVVLNAQSNNNDFIKSIKIYNQISTASYSSIQTNNSNNSYAKSTTNVTNWLHGCIAYQWKTKSNKYSEISISEFSFKRNLNSINIIDNARNIDYIISGAIITTQNYAAVFEHQFIAANDKWKKWKPSLAYAIGPYFNQVKSVPLTLVTFHTNSRNLGVHLHLTPRLIYLLNSRFYLDLNMPLNLLQANLHNQIILNPSFSSREQKKWTTELKVLPQAYMLRFGLGIQI
mgnify:CR=1 FL=1